MRRLALADAATTAWVYGLSYDERLPWLAGRHGREVDLTFFQQVIFAQHELCGGFSDDRLTGFVAFKPNWVEQLYVLPEFQGCAIGRRLLEKAQEGQSMVELWTFRRNTAARRFYERNGFVALRETDGSDNEERESDVLYHWDG